MAQIPWFPLFAADLLMDDDLFNLDPKAEGLLVRMWCLCWVDGYAPKGVEALSLKVRRPVSYVRKYLPEVVRFFHEDAKGNLWSQRLEAERQKAADKSQKCRAAITTRWEKKRKGEQPTEQTPVHTDEHTNVSTDAIPSQSPSPSPKEPPPTPSPAAQGPGKPKRLPRVQVLGAYPEELLEAVKGYRGLMKDCKSEEVLNQFQADKRFIAKDTGPTETVWKAWQGRVGSIVHGSAVTHADVLSAVNRLIQSKGFNATKGLSLNVPMLSTLINSDLFVDALVKVKEVEHAS